ncbi:MAG: TIGR04283 family arsenosugar biosynthesis glycosyltransferase [Puia sp.]
MCSHKQFEAVNHISIIIPTLNERKYLPGLLAYINDMPDHDHLAEIIICDANSSDGTADIAASFGAQVILCEQPGRAIQMNAGAAKATGDILYFLHADTRPPEQFITAIISNAESGLDAGCFRLKFDDDHWFLTANAWFTRFNIDAIRFGDQSLFVKKQAFEAIGGFREDLYIMEDQEIIYRIRKNGEFGVMPDYVTTSARKYRVNGVYRMQGIFFYIYFAYILGVPQPKLAAMYKKFIRKS